MISNIRSVLKECALNLGEICKAMSFPNNLKQLKIVMARIDKNAFHMSTLYFLVILQI